MSLEGDRKLDMVQKYLDMSDSCWEDAIAAKEKSRWSMTANRIYYAALNAARALLLHDDHPVHSHNGTKQLFGQYYVITGKMAPEQGKLFSQLETMREKADYDCFFKATEKDIEEKFLPTKTLIDAMKNLVTCKK